MNTKYMNPYLAGFFLGLVLLAAVFITGRGLGASGALKSVVVWGVSVTQPAHSQQAEFYKEYRATQSATPLKSWLVFEVAGVIIGAFISGLVSDRLKFKTEAGPQTTTVKRLVFAFAGGLLFSLGAQFARGCTSGAALSGMAVLSTAGFLTMMMIFGSAYAVAWFFRKLWI